MIALLLSLSQNVMMRRTSQTAGLHPFLYPPSHWRRHTFQWGLKSCRDTAAGQTKEVLCSVTVLCSRSLLGDDISGGPGAHRQRQTKTDTDRQRGRQGLLHYQSELMTMVWYYRSHWSRINGGKADTHEEGDHDGGRVDLSLGGILHQLGACLFVVVLLTNSHSNSSMFRSCLFTSTNWCWH